MQKIRWTGYLLVLLFGTALTCAFVWKPQAPARFDGLSSVPVPSTLNGLAAQPVAVDATTKDALASAQVSEWNYRDASGRDIDFTLIGGTDRSALHDPRSCIVGSGWQITSDRVEQLGSGSQSVPTRACIASYGNPIDGAVTSNDILYLYVTHRRVIASATQIRAALLESALLDQTDAPVYFVRFMCPATVGAGYGAEHARLTEFAASMWTRIAPALLRGGQAPPGH